MGREEQGQGPVEAQRRKDPLANSDKHIPTPLSQNSSDPPPQTLG